MVTGSGPPFTTLTSISPGSGSRIRSRVSSSTGGKAARKTPTGPKRRKARTSAASNTRRAKPLNQSGRPLWRGGSGARGGAGGSRPGAGGVLSSGMGRLLHQEHAAPAQLGELALVGVEHEGAGMLVGKLEHRALTLGQRDHVGVLEVPEIGAGA